MKKILVVDDEQSVCEMLKKFLTMKGYEAIIAYSGKEAITAVKDKKPDAVLLDIIMPSMNGMQTLKKIREISATLPVIMVTAVRDAQIGRKYLESGASDYITKPFSLDYLDKTLKSKLQALL